MKIRPYQTSDEKDVIQLWDCCGLLVPHNHPIRDIERKMKVDPEWFLVGEIDNEIMATCMIGYEGHRGWINYLAVAPNHQRKGYATLLMEKAETILLEAGCPKINLQIRETNQAVIDFYHQLGYKIDKAVSMGKRLETDTSYKVESLINR